MKKIVVIVAVIIILIVILLWISSKGRQETDHAFKSEKAQDKTAKVHLILNEEAKLASYSIVFKGLKDDVESVYFNYNGQDSFKASGPREIAKEGEEVIVHGLWREKSNVPLDDIAIEALKRGEMDAIVYFKNKNSKPFVTKLVQSSN